MTAPHAIVERTGPLSTIQDLGRTKGRSLGIAPSGAMDKLSCLWANRLLDNDPGDAVIEVTLGGLVLHLAVDTVVALAGADCQARIEARPVHSWRSVQLGAGETLRLGFTSTGMRSYLAVPGGLDVPTAFGSASTAQRDGLPGLLGRPLRRGDVLHWRDPNRPVPRRRIPPSLIPPHVIGHWTADADEDTAARESGIALPLFTGYEWHRFSESDRTRVFASAWTVDPASDRTAVQLQGPALHSGPKVLDSSPLVDGTVQVTGAGRPLVFMRDRPTIGGYAKLGSVAPMGLDAIAQARPGTPIRFVPADGAAEREQMARRVEFFGIGR